MLYKLFAVLALAMTCVTAETHVISFDNRSVPQLQRLWTPRGVADFFFQVRTWHSHLDIPERTGSLYRRKICLEWTAIWSYRVS